MPLVFSSPPISTPSAHGLTFLFALCYVGSLYISKNARLSFSKDVKPTVYAIPREKTQDERWRDDPDVIRARLVAVTAATAVCCALVFALLWNFVGDDDLSLGLVFDSTITRLGFKIYFDWNLLFPHLVTPILFLGPLYAAYLGYRLPFQKYCSLNSVASKFFCWQGIRNYMMAPVTEEIVFRACVLAVYHISGASTRRMIFLAPLSFGLAHVHHAWDTFNRYGRTASAAKRAVIMSLFQFSYTTLFGFHCSYLFLRTGSIYPPISAHIFCNIMGLPEIAWELRVFPKYKRFILFAYVTGIIAFAFALGPWTRVAGGLYWRDEQDSTVGSY